MLNKIFKDMKSELRKENVPDSVTDAINFFIEKLKIDFLIGLKETSYITNYGIIMD